MNDNVSQIKQYPVCSVFSFDVSDFKTCFFNFFFNYVSDCLDLAFRIRLHDYEIIRKQTDSLNVQSDNILSAFAVSCFNDNF